MRTVDIDPIETARLVGQLFVSHGASEHNARAVADHLVESDRLHLPSHGLMRVTQYLKEIAKGQLVPDAEPTVVGSLDTVRHVDGHEGFGQVAGLFAVDQLASLAAERGTAFVTVRNVQHTGRLGAYTENLAKQGYVVLAFASGAPRFHRMVPFGGKDGRMSTNPMAWAAPTPDGFISADFSTSAAPEGKIRVLHGAGQPAPSDAITDSEGRMTTDTALFYGGPDGDPAPGSLLPLGGSVFGHKGYALALLSECLSTVLAGDRSDVGEGRGNNLALMAIRGDAELAERVGDLKAYMKSSRPVTAGRDVLVPGEPERRGYSETGPLTLPEFVLEGLNEELVAVGLKPAATV
ncbi:Ldh family oxidoreductase [Aeromicrobium sp. A1-2]|uniref:Ldh family oxidoreductase n=1 Tax=Aeromicrobium sp. A1-2 TaxID=2107713 RepID=UPI0013C31AB1|nr:Ldh family oxidoreductase [Aeromicrobium sp. A1-2]